MKKAPFPLTFFFLLREKRGLKSVWKGKKGAVTFFKRKKGKDPFFEEKTDRQIDLTLKNPYNHTRVFCKFRLACRVYHTGFDVAYLA